MAPKYVLNYFDLPGRGEPIRVLFHAAGVEFTDNRITIADWRNCKTDVQKFPIGQLPTLEVDGKIICQSSTIYRYLAREFKYYGDNAQDAALVDQVLETVLEVLGVVLTMIGEHDGETEKKKFEEFFASDKLKLQLTFLNNLLRSNNGGSGWFVGTKLSLADIIFYVHGDSLQRMNAKVFESFPELVGLLGRVAAVENVKKYLDLTMPRKHILEIVQIG